MPNTPAHIKKALIEALEKSLGVVTIACKTAGCGRTTFYEYYRSDEKFKDEVDSLKDVALDFAESQLHKKIKEGSDTAIIFYLKCQGKKRGYVERSEQIVSIQDHGAILNWEDGSDGKTDNTTV